MAIPKFSVFFKPFLQAIADGGVREIKDIRSHIASSMSLSEDDLALCIPSGNITVFACRVGWAKTYLVKAGMVASPARGRFVITADGKKLLEEGQEITEELLLKVSPSFVKFKFGDWAVSNPPSATQTTHEASTGEAQQTPQETMVSSWEAINAQLADDLLSEIMNKSPAFFEQLVVDLLGKMGYGEGFVTKQSADDGIDGVINEDKLGFNLIYIQAKRWQTDTPIGKPEIQKFVGAMAGPPRIANGLFITTARFSKGAQEYANAQHIILVDGQRLTRLMIEYGLGVSTQRTFALKRIDSGYFEED